MLQGAFGYVYRARQGRKSWALKVFSSDVHERQRRYAEVSAHLQSATSPVFVDFKYADDDDHCPDRERSVRPVPRTAHGVV